jgi:hypothetical protein
MDLLFFVLADDGISPARVDQRNSFNIEYKLPAFGSGWFTVLNPQFY